MATQVAINGYGNYSSSNYGVNSLRVTVGNLDLYFSYKTVIAFQDGVNDIRVRKNEWSTTTGKHLNWIDDGDKSSRLSSQQFEDELSEVLKKYKLTV